MSIKVTTEQFIERAKKVHGEDYDYSLSEYKKNNEKIIILCKQHGEFKKTLSTHIKGEGCPKCSRDLKSKRDTHTKEYFVEKAKKTHGDKYDYTNSEYTHSNAKIGIVCKEHGEFIQVANNHINGNGCPKCGIAETIKKVSLDTSSFIKKAIEKHGNEYDYEKVEYIQSTKKIIIPCKIHGDFRQVPTTHLAGSGCNKCSHIKQSEKMSSNTEEFIKRVKIIHGEKYGYSKVEYTHTDKKVIIICSVHGEFQQTPSKHLEGRGCQKCGMEKCGLNKTKSQEDFIKQATNKHGDKYDYSKVNYRVGTEKVEIICKMHGAFSQRPSGHLQGSGCFKCGALNGSAFKREDYIKNADGKICTFYTIRCFNEEEEFYKIGITKYTVKDRYYRVRDMPYSYEIISEIYGEAGFILDIEEKHKQELRDFHYLPQIPFGGSKQECFTQYKVNEK